MREALPASSGGNGKVGLFVCALFDDFTLPSSLRQQRLQQELQRAQKRAFRLFGRLPGRGVW